MTLNKVPQNLMERVTDYISSLLIRLGGRLGKSLLIATPEKYDTPTLFQGVHDVERGAAELDGAGHRLHSLQVDQHQGGGTGQG